MNIDKELKKLETRRKKYYSSKSFYEIAKDILKQQNIKTINDFIQKYPSEFPEVIGHEGNEWIQEIYWAFKQEMSRVDEKASNGIVFFDNQSIWTNNNGLICETSRELLYKDANGKFSSLFPPHSSLGTIPVTKSKGKNKSKKKHGSKTPINEYGFGLVYSAYLPALSCIFPDRVCIVPADIMGAFNRKVEDSKYKIEICELLGLDILRRVLMYEDLFKNKLIHAYPHLIVSEREEAEIIYTDSENICYMEGFGYSNRKNDKQISLENLFIELPWLMGIHVEDFLELRDKYNTEFSRYQLKVEELLLNSTRGCPFENLFVKEYNEASLEIRNIILNKKDDLKRIGKNTIIGTILTAVPIILEKSNFTYFDSSVFSSVVGGCTLFNSYSDFLKISKLERKNPYWLLWKLEQSSKRSLT